MAVWNVVSTVVSLVEAPSAEDAIAGQRIALEHAGFSVHDDLGAGHTPNAFESELGAEPDITVTHHVGDSRLHVRTSR